MTTLCDVNVLLALCSDRHVHHGVACQWAEGVAKRHEVAVCRVTQLGLLRLLNNPAVMKEEALSTEECWRVYETLMEDERFVFRAEPAGLEGALKKATLPQSFAPKLWQDAYLAAFAMGAGLQLVTFDRGFRNFGGLNCRVLEG